VRSRATPRFWAAYRELPPEIRELARKAYRLFRDNLTWFWIGTHAEYDRLLEKL